MVRLSAAIQSNDRGSGLKTVLPDRFSGLQKKYFGGCSSKMRPLSQRYEGSFLYTILTTLHLFSVRKPCESISCLKRWRTREENLPPRWPETSMILPPKMECGKSNVEVVAGAEGITWTSCEWLMRACFPSAMKRKLKGKARVQSQCLAISLIMLDRRHCSLAHPENCDSQFHQCSRY